MALATKCPHCSTVFRVAHDQLKLRGGIVRCGSCNEVFDGNAALLEPLANPPPVAMPGLAVAVPAAFDPSPPSTPAPFDEPDAALDHNAAEALSGEPIYTLELDTALEPADHGQFNMAQTDAGSLADPESDTAESRQAAAATTHMDAPQAEPGSESIGDEQPDTAEPTPEDPLAIKPMTHEELEAALDVELALIGLSITADADATGTADFDAAAAPSSGTDLRREPTLAPESRYDLDEADEEALVQLAAARERDTTPETHTLLRAASAPSQDRFEPSEVHRLHEPEPAPAPPVKEEEPEDPNEPGFVKRDRRRERHGKTTTIAMAAGTLLLIGALAAQGMTTFRNQLAASYPALKPTLQSVCRAFGCKIELPTQIDQLVIEQGELQTLSETTFSFTTLLRNQSASAQTWPHIELVLDDANDKAILRRVFTPRDYLGSGAALEQGFAPRSEQSVKLTFELKQLKASGYHIAVFYP